MTLKIFLIVISLFLLWLYLKTITRYTTTTSILMCHNADAHLYIIHMSHRLDRNSNVQETVTKCAADSVRAHVTKAVIGKETMHVHPFLDMSLTPNAMRSVLRKGEVGCLQSHINCWSLGLDEGCFVAEDDAILSDSCMSIMKREVKILSSQYGAFVLMARYSKPRAMHKPCPLQNIGDNIVAPNCPCYNTNMYWISADACKILLEIAENPMNHMPSDDFISSVSQLHPTLRSTSQHISMYALKEKAVTPMITRSDTS